MVQFMLVRALPISSADMYGPSKMSRPSPHCLQGSAMTGVCTWPGPRGAPRRGRSRTAQHVRTARPRYRRRNLLGTYPHRADPAQRLTRAVENVRSDRLPRSRRRDSQAVVAAALSSIHAITKIPLCRPIFAWSSGRGCYGWPKCGGGRAQHPQGIGEQLVERRGRAGRITQARAQN